MFLSRFFGGGRARSDGRRSRLGAAAALVATLATATTAEARPYVTLHDDGTLAGRVSSPLVVLDKIMKQYDATGQKRPHVISLWTAFPQNKNEVETLFVPASNDVTGIGLDDSYGGDGTFDYGYAPLRAILLHNDVLAIDKRAALVHAPSEGYAQYLFLLELSHVWGPAARIPGGEPGALVGFPFHWSFWMDASGSPAGGNLWKDNGDGTFTTQPQAPKDVTYSMLDLYLMGLADPSEVPPFGLLENAVPPSDVQDPFTGRELSATSFPNFAPTPVTVKATRRTLTIDDVVTATGTRAPARTSSPQSFELGVVLMVGADATDDDVAKAEAVMDPIASSLAPAFERATRGRGKMTVVTQSLPDAPPPAEGDPPNADAPPPETTTSTSGCSAAPVRATSAAAPALLFAVGALLRRRGRARSSRSCASGRSRSATP